MNVGGMTIMSIDGSRLPIMTAIMAVITTTIIMMPMMMPIVPPKMVTMGKGRA